MCLCVVWCEPLVSWLRKTGFRNVVTRLEYRLCKTGLQVSPSLPFHIITMLDARSLNFALQDLVNFPHMIMDMWEQSTILGYKFPGSHCRGSVSHYDTRLWLMNPSLQYRFHQVVCLAVLSWVMYDNGAFGSLWSLQAYNILLI